MCALCGRLGLVHEEGGFPVPLQAGEAGSSSSGGSGAAALSAGAQTEISYLNGLTSGGTIAATSFWTWNYNTPATYSSTSWAAKWGSPTPGTSGGTVTYWFDAASAWTATEMAALQSGLALWSALANINFTLATGASTANFIFYENNSGTAYEDGSQSTTSVGSSVTGSHTSTGTVISIDTDVAGFGPLGASFGTYGGYPYQTLLHEIGHLIGLGHGGGYNGSVNVATQQFSAYDTRLWTIMSYIDPWTTSAKYYSSYPVTGTNWGISADGYYNRPTTPMILDIAAAQQLYGAATSGPLAGGGHVFGFNSNLASSIKAYFDFTVNTNPVITIWASGTNNTLDLSGWSNPATINLNPGTFSSAHGLTNNIGIAEGAVIDKAIGGGGADSIIGSSINNTLTGKGGSDTINGAGGSDTAVYSGSKSQYQITQNADGSIRLIDLRSGSPDGTDTVSNVEFFQFADGTYSATGLFNNLPGVTVTAQVSATAGQSLAASSLFSVSDADGDAITKYQFWDGTPGGGYFTVNGMTKGAQQIIEVTAAELAQTSFIAGLGTDVLYVRAYDGKNWSVESGVWTSFQLTGSGSANHAPAVTVTAQVNATTGQSLAASSLFSVSDADGNATTKYQFWDGTPGGGYFTVNGVTKGAQQIIEVTAAELAQTSFVAGSGTDVLYVRAYDGTNWSVESGVWTSFQLTGSPSTNNAPVVTVTAQVNATTGQSLAASSLFSVSDADGNATTKYQFWDGTPGGGYFTVNGVTKGAQQIIEVTAAELAQTSFVAGSGSDILYVRAYDGANWSVESGVWTSFQLTGSPSTNNAPVVTVTAQVNATTGQTLAASSLFSVSDADGNTMTKYQFWDGTPGGGQFIVNGVTKGAQQIIEVTAAELAQMSFVVGSGTDVLYVRAYDGANWSVESGVWTSFQVTGGSHAAQTALGAWASSNESFIAASDSNAHNDVSRFFSIDHTPDAVGGYAAAEIALDLPRHQSEYDFHLV